MYGRQWSAGEGSTPSNHHQSDGVTVTADDCFDDNLPLSSATGCDVTDMQQNNSAPVDLVASCSAHAHKHSPTSASASAFSLDVNVSSAQQYNHGLCEIFFIIIVCPMHCIAALDRI